MSTDSSDDSSSGSESECNSKATIAKANSLLRVARSKNPPTDEQVNPTMAALAKINPRSKPLAPPLDEMLRSPSVKKHYEGQLALYEHDQEIKRLESIPSNPDHERLFLLTGAAQLFESVYLNTQADADSRWAARSNLDAIYARHPHLKSPQVIALRDYEDRTIQVAESTNLALLKPLKIGAVEDSEKKVDAYFKNPGIRRAFMERVFAKELLPIAQEQDKLEKARAEQEKKEKEAQKAETKKANRAKAAEAEKRAAQKAAAELEAQKKAAELKAAKEKTAAQKVAKEKAAQQALQKLKSQKRMNDDQDPEKILLEACKAHVTKKEYPQASQGCAQLLLSSNEKIYKEAAQVLQRLHDEKKDTDATYALVTLHAKNPAGMIELFIEAENRRDLKKEKKDAEPQDEKLKRNLKKIPDPEDAQKTMTVTTTQLMANALEALSTLDPAEHPNVNHALAVHFFHQAEVFPSIKMGLLEQAVGYAKNVADSKQKIPVGCYDYAYLANEYGNAKFQKIVALGDYARSDSALRFTTNRTIFEAESLLKDASSRKNIRATHNLALLQEYRFVFFEEKQKLDDALLNYQRALESKHPDAQESIETLLLDGTGEKGKNGIPLNNRRRKVLFDALKQYAPSSALLQKKEYKDSPYYKASLKELVPGNTEYYEGLFWLDQGETDRAIELLKKARDEQKNKAAAATLLDVAMHSDDDGTKLFAIHDYWKQQSEIPFHARVILSESAHDALKGMIAQGNVAAPYICIEGFLNDHMVHVKEGAIQEVCHLLDVAEILIASNNPGLPVRKLMNPQFVIDMLRFSRKNESAAVLKKVAAIAQNRLQKGCSASDTFDLKKLIETMHETISDIEARSVAIKQDAESPTPLQQFEVDLDAADPDQKKFPEIAKILKVVRSESKPVEVPESEKPRGIAQSATTNRKPPLDAIMTEEVLQQQMMQTIETIIASIPLGDQQKTLSIYRNYVSKLRADSNRAEFKKAFATGKKQKFNLLESLNNKRSSEPADPLLNRELKLLTIANDAIVEENYDRESALKAFCAQYPIDGSIMVARELVQNVIFDRDIPAAKRFLKQSILESMVAKRKTNEIPEFAETTKIVENAARSAEAMPLEATPSLKLQQPVDDKSGSATQSIKDEISRQNIAKHGTQLKAALLAGNPDEILKAQRNIVYDMRAHITPEIKKLQQRLSQTDFFSRAEQDVKEKVLLGNPFYNIEVQMINIAEKLALNERYDYESALKEICNRHPVKAAAMIARELATDKLFPKDVAKAKDFLNQAIRECVQSGKNMLEDQYLSETRALVNAVTQQAKEASKEKQKGMAFSLEREKNRLNDGLLKNNRDNALQGFRAYASIYRNNQKEIELPSLKDFPDVYDRVVQSIEQLTENFDDIYFRIQLDLLLRLHAVDSEKSDLEEVLQGFCDNYPTWGTAMVARELGVGTLVAQDKKKAHEYIKQAIAESIQQGQTAQNQQYIQESLHIITLAKDHNLQPQAPSTMSTSPANPAADKEYADRVEDIISRTVASNAAAKPTLAQPVKQEKLCEAQLRQHFEREINKIKASLTSKDFEAMQSLFDLFKVFRINNAKELYLELTKDNPVFAKAKQLGKGRAKGQEEQMFNLMNTISLELFTAAERALLEQDYDIDLTLKEICKSYPVYGAGIIARGYATNDVLPPDKNKAMHYLKQAKDTASKRGRKPQIVAYLNTIQWAIDSCVAFKNSVTPTEQILQPQISAAPTLSTPPSLEAPSSRASSSATTKAETQPFSGQELANDYLTAVSTHSQADPALVETINRREALIQTFAGEATKIMVAIADNNKAEAISTLRNLIGNLRTNNKKDLMGFFAYHKKTNVSFFNTIESQLSKSFSNKMKDLHFAVELKLLMIAKNIFIEENYDLEANLKEFCDAYPTIGAAMIAREFVSDKIFEKDISKADEFVKRAVKECYQAGRKIPEDEYLTQSLRIVHDASKSTVVSAQSQAPVPSSANKKTNLEIVENEIARQLIKNEGMRLAAALSSDNMDELVKSRRNIVYHLRTNPAPDIKKLFVTVNNIPAMREALEHAKTNLICDDPHLDLEIKLIAIAEKAATHNPYDPEPDLKDLCTQYPAKGAALIARELVADKLFAKDTDKARGYINQAKKECFQQQSPAPEEVLFIEETSKLIDETAGQQPLAQAHPTPRLSASSAVEADFNNALTPQQLLQAEATVSRLKEIVQDITSRDANGDSAPKPAQTQTPNQEKFSDTRLRQDFDREMSKINVALNSKKHTDAFILLFDIFREFRVNKAKELYLQLTKDNLVLAKIKRLDKEKIRGKQNTNELTSIGLQLFGIAEKILLEENYDMEPAFTEICKSNPVYGAGFIAEAFAQSVLFAPDRDKALRYLKQAHAEASKRQKPHMLAYVESIKLSITEGLRRQNI